MYNALMKSILFAFNIFPAEQEALKKNNYYFESPLLHASHVVPEYSSTKKSESFSTILYHWQAVILKN